MDAASSASLTKAMAERIAARFDPLQVVLFGSYARGDNRPDSDIDLLVVLQSVVDKHQTSAAIGRALNDVPVPKDILVTTPDEIRRRGALIGPLLRPALKEGKVLFARNGWRADIGMTDAERLVETRAWLAYAHDDLMFAQDAATDAKRPARYICFLAQQSAEKALKAALIFEQLEFPRTHNVDELRALLPDSWQAVRDALPDLGTLSSWAAQARYPDALRDASRDEAGIALAQAQAVWAAISPALRSRGVSLD